MSILLQINNLEMAYGNQLILDNANLTISENQKIAVVGRNGAGKSTLFRLIIGEEDPTGGEIIVHPGTRIGYLTQHSPFLPAEKIMDFLQRYSGQESWFCAKIAAQFQIKNDLFDRPVDSLAGGYQMRVKLIAMLAKEPNLLLLDEPTNYLDLSTILLLENFLKKYKGAFLLISHDREFIQKTCQQTLEIDQGKTYLFPQPLSEYLAYKEEKLATTEKHNQKVVQEKARLQTFVDRFGAKASKAAQAKSKMKQIDRLKTIEVVNKLDSARIKIPRVEDKKGAALTVEDLSIGYLEKIVASRINFDINRGERIAIVGDNGQGKTTFLKTIAGELQRLQGEFKWGSNVRFSYYAQHTPATLNSTSLVKEFLQASSPRDTNPKDIFEMAGNFLFKDEALDKEISVLSGGEKARLCLAGILLQKNHVLLLDEPTNHLDFETVEALANSLSQSNITVIFVSHNRTFVETLANGIVEVKNGQAARYHHNYADYVYHMRKAIEQEQADPNGSLAAGNQVATANFSSANPNEIRQQIKKLKNKIHKIENTIKSFTEEKTQILSWFEAHPTEYSEEKSKRIGDLINLLEEQEAAWLEAHLHLEKFN